MSAINKNSLINKENFPPQSINFDSKENTYFDINSQSDSTTKIDESFWEFKAVRKLHKERDSFFSERGTQEPIQYCSISTIHKKKTIKISIEELDNEIDSLITLSPPHTISVKSKIENLNKTRIRLQTERLHTILQKYPALKNISKDKLYRFFIDASRWDNSTMMEFENEIGYMSAMMKACIWMLETNPPLDEKFYLKLHDLAVDKVYDHEHSLFKQGFREYQDGKEGFGLKFEGELPTVSITGKAELLAKRNEYSYKDSCGDTVNFFKDSIENPNETIVLSAPTHKKIFSLSGKTLEVDLTVLTEKGKEQHITKQFLFEIAFGSEITYDGQVARSLYRETMKYQAACNSLKNKMINLRPTHPESCKRNVKELFKRYHTKIQSAVEEDDKLKAIILLCQDLDQLHVFVDGNIRTAGILLLNKLLLDNNFSPCCLKDPNCLDCLSIDELVEKVKEGQELFSSKLVN